MLPMESIAPWVKHPGEEKGISSAVSRILLSRESMKKIVLAAVGLLTVAFLVFSLAEIENILATLRQSNPLYLLVAVAVELLLLLNNTATFIALYKLVGLDEDRRQLFMMVTAATFLNVIAPSAGVGGVAVFMNGARQRGLPIGRVTVAGVLYILYDYASLFAVLAAGFGVLIQNGRLNLIELVAAGILLLISTSIGIGLVIGYRSPQQLGSLLTRLARGLNRLLRPLLKKEPLHVDQVYAFSVEIGEGLKTVRANHRQMVTPLLFTLMNKLLLILVLALSFQTMGVLVDGKVVLAGFSIAHLFFYASITPSGVGFVDSILPVALGSLGTPPAQAVLVALLYRGVSFWLPLGLGALAFRWLHSSAPTRPQATVNPS